MLDHDDVATESARDVSQQSAEAVVRSCLFDGYDDDVELVAGVTAEGGLS